MAVSETLQNIANAATSLALVVTGVTLLLNKKRIWRDKLTEKQLDHLLKLSEDLYKNATDMFYVRNAAMNMQALNTELVDFEKGQPKEVERQVGMSLFFRNLINQTELGNNVLYPQEFEFKVLQDYVAFLKEYKPFSFDIFKKMTTDDYKQLQAETFRLVDKINKTIKQM
jgi:hypothetical protein